MLFAEGMPLFFCFGSPVCVFRVDGGLMQSLLIVGCGDIGLRVVRQLKPHIRVVALTSSPERVPELRACGVTPMVGNLDNMSSLQRLGGICSHVLYLVPPLQEMRTDARQSPLPGRADVDSRCLHLCATLLKHKRPERLVYISTTGVYASGGQQWMDETTPVKPVTSRAHKRIAAEMTMRHFGRVGKTAVSILRVPGIYALDRQGGNPAQRLQQGMQVLAREDDVYTQHIQADDLARICIAALFHGKPQRVVNAVDDSDMRMGDYFDLAADIVGMPRPERLTRQDAARVMSPLLFSFMSESRRIGNQRLKRELGVRLTYPTVREGLAGLAKKASE